VDVLINAARLYSRKAFTFCLRTIDIQTLTIRDGPAADRQDLLISGWVLSVARKLSSDIPPPLR